MGWKNVKMHFNGRNSRTWWLTRKEGQGKSGRSMPKETKPLGNFGTKIILSKLETLRIGYKWLHDSTNFLYPPKMQAPPGTSPLSGSLIPLPYTPPGSLQHQPVRKLHFNNLSTRRSSRGPPSHLPASLKPDPPPRRRLPLGILRRQLFLPHLLWGPGSGGQFDRWKLAFPLCFAQCSFELFYLFLIKVFLI